MRFVKASLLILFILSTGTAYAEFENLNGSDWVKMTPKQKEIFVYTGIGGLERQNVFISKLPSYYISALDKLLAAGPEMKTEYLDNLFVFCVHESEPQAQAAINEIRQNNKNLGQ